MRALHPRTSYALCMNSIILPLLFLHRNASPRPWTLGQTTNTQVHNVETQLCLTWLHKPDFSIPTCSPSILRERTAHLWSTRYGPVSVLDALCLLLHLTPTITWWTGVYCLHLTEEEKWNSKILAVLLDVVGSIWTQLWPKPKSVFFLLYWRDPCFLMRRTSSKDKHCSGSLM